MIVELFQYCPNHDQEKSPMGACLLCGGVKFVQVGVTLWQVDRWASWERWLNGDTGLTQDQRNKAEGYILDRLRRKGIVK